MVVKPFSILAALDDVEKSKRRRTPLLLGAGIQMVKVLHVLGSLNRGGIESWLMQVLQQIDREEFQLDFLCLSGQPGLYAPEVAALGSKIHIGHLRINLTRFNAEFSQLLAAEAYDVVHSHVHHFSGYILWRAARSGVRTRIAHSFTAPPSIGVPPVRRIYLKLMRSLINRYATAGLGNSSASMRSLFGANWQQDQRWQLMYLGIDLTPFRRGVAREKLREQYGLPAGSMVIGHVGRLTEAKNHRFLIDVVAELEKKHSNIWCIIVGDGPLRVKLEEYARHKRVGHLIFTGGVAETRPLYAIMDLFVFPSLWEGLPQAMIEAQAAGLRCLCANSVTSEVVVVPEAVQFFSLSDGVAACSQLCGDLLQLPALDQMRSLIAVAASQFSIEQSVRALSQIYVQGTLTQRAPR